MAIIGVGTDIIQVERVRGVLSRHPETFRARHFTPSEQAYCDRHRDPAERYASRFAAKEAVAKALGTGFGDLLGFLDISITHDPSGKPLVELSDRAHATFGTVTIHLSMSHCKEYATAFAVIEKNERTQ